MGRQHRRWLMRIATVTGPQPISARSAESRVRVSATRSACGVWNSGELSDQIQLSAGDTDSGR
jgi:hypothetical protein